VYDVNISLKNDDMIADELTWNELPLLSLEADFLFLGLHDITQHNVVCLF
jgi:hypothetical protein